MRKKKKTGNGCSMTQLEGRTMMAADLQITNVRIDTAATATDGTLVCTVDVKNRGNANVNSGRTTVWLTLSRDDKYGNADDVKIATQIINTQLKARKSTTLTFSQQLTPSIHKSGMFKVFAHVDPNNTVKEDNEKNNTRSSGGQVAIYDPIMNGRIEGTKKNDNIYLYAANNRAVAIVNGAVLGRRLDALPSITIETGTGNDKIVAAADFPVKMFVNGGSGNDTIVGGAADDVLYGAKGNDRITGGGGKDLIQGGSGNKDRATKDPEDIFESIEIM